MDVEHIKKNNNWSELLSGILWREKNQAALVMDVCCLELPIKDRPGIKQADIFACCEENNVVWEKLKKNLKNKRREEAEQIIRGLVKEKHKESANGDWVCSDRLELKASSRMAKKYYAFIVVRLLGEAAKKRALLAYVLNRIAEEVENTNELEDARMLEVKLKHLLQELRTEWILMRQYAGHILNQYGLPSAEVFTELSAARYEKSESEARIYFKDENLETVAELSDIGEENREINGCNLRTIRKLMEICKRKRVFLYAEKERRQGEQGAYRICRLAREKDPEARAGIYIKFGGFLQWSLVVDGREEVVFHDGNYAINSSEEDASYLQVIENELQGIREPGVKEMLKELIRILRDQKHGTSVVIGENRYIEKEADRLCTLNQGTRFEPCNFYGNGRDERESGRRDRDVLLSITEIDGAVFMNHEGECLAIGVLVDGEFEKPGDPGRGSRYNSINNYVMSQKEGWYVGIIVSEDGMINVVANDAAKNIPEK